MICGVGVVLAGRPLLRVLYGLFILARQDSLPLIRKARQMATFTLDQLKADVEKNYATLTIEVGKDDKIDLRNLLRIPSEARSKITDKLDELEKIQDNEEISQTEMLSRTTEIASEVLALAAGKRGDDLLAVIDGDDALLMEIMSKWTEKTELGEAESSSD